MANRKAKLPDFDEFRRRAGDPALSIHERIGFDDRVRAGMAEPILADIRAKLRAFRTPASLIVDIGSGCGELARLIGADCERRGSTLVRIDSAEMLAALPSAPGEIRLAGRFPGVPGIAAYDGRADAVLVYSVLQYVRAEGDPFSFLDAAVRSLRAGGELLIGDIPNASARSRFLASPEGLEYHRRRYGTATPVEGADGEMDDAFVLSVLRRYREAGCESYLLPQPDTLPMASRREDILVRKR